MELVVAVDFGSTFTKMVAVDLAAERVVATSQANSSVDTDINVGFDLALRALRAEVGSHGHWTARFLASSSAAGGLRMAAIGLVPSLTAEAAKRAALCAGARVLDVLSSRITLAEVGRLEATRPEIILLVGGTDGGNAAVVTHNARMLAKSAVAAPILYAGNKAAADEVQALLEAAGKETFVAANVMPEIGVLDIEPARAVIREIFMRRIVEAKGIAKVRDRVGDILMPTPTAVLQAAQLLAEGCEGESGIGELVLVDVGGATTDIHSIATGHPSRSDWIPRGLPEPRAKRTVEGDLGLRWNAEGIVETAGAARLRARLGHPELDVAARAKSLSALPSTLPGTDEDYAFDTALAALAVDVAMERHAGRLETVYGFDGPATLLYGKDLSAVRHVIGVGGVFARGRGASAILRAALAGPESTLSTRPRDAALAVDKDYVFFAMGLLAALAPATALRLLKAHLHPSERQ